jgi:Tfp pilus assembly protein PilO
MQVDMNDIFHYHIKKKVILFVILFLIILSIGYFIVLSKFKIILSDARLQEEDYKQQSEIAELLNQILKVGVSNNVIITLFNPGEMSKEEYYKKMLVKAVMVANYFEFASFISQITNLDKVVSINNFTLSNENKADMLGAKLAQKANANNLLTAEVIIEVYLLNKGSNELKKI